VVDSAMNDASREKGGEGKAAFGAREKGALSRRKGAHLNLMIGEKRFGGTSSAGRKGEKAGAVISKREEGRAAVIRHRGKPEKEVREKRRGKPSRVVIEKGEEEAGSPRGEKKTGGAKWKGEKREVHSFPGMERSHRHREKKKKKRTMGPAPKGQVLSSSSFEKKRERAWPA